MFLTDDDTEAIRKLVEEDADAVRRADWDSLSSLFAEDAVRMPPNQAPITGRKAIRSWLQTFPQVDDFTIRVEEIDGRGDLAFLRASYTVSLGRKSANPVRDTGSLLAILKKQADGSWLWSRDIWHSMGEA